MKKKSKTPAIKLSYDEHVKASQKFKRLFGQGLSIREAAKLAYEEAVKAELISRKKKGA